MSVAAKFDLQIEKICEDNVPTWGDGRINLHEKT